VKTIRHNFSNLDLPNLVSFHRLIVYPERFSCSHPLPFNIWRTMLALLFDQLVDQRCPFPASPEFFLCCPDLKIVR